MAKKVRRRTVKRKPHRDPDSRVQVEQKLGELPATMRRARRASTEAKANATCPTGHSPA